MRKVTTIDLNGRAYQLEEDGYHRLQKYLQKAEAALSDNPDKIEVIADLEQAIADKCERLLKDGKNVVSAEQLDDILQHMGPVEGDETVSDKRAEAKPVKRLYTISEGGVIFGVCKGIATYLNIEPNIVRVAFVLLALVTHGFGLLLYAALGIFLPHARTDADLAAASGKPVTAQGIIDQARERATDPETMHAVSNGIVRVCRIAAQIVGVGFAIIFGILTFAWVWTLWQQLLGRLEFHGQLVFLNGWREAVAITLVYLVAAIPIFLLFRVFDRFAGNSRQSKVSSISEATLAVLWGVAIVGCVAFATAYGGTVRSYVDGHRGRLDIGATHVCVDGNRCGDSSTIEYRPSLHYPSR
ncbi:MAG TPA: PspC domain-containing protein [Candidatus Saccharimonadales bacterium]|nr:PspC domain-containing protein [Candidatus Saccharimonadales bacterium]